MRVPLAKGLRRGTRYLVGRFFPRALILLYHRVAEPPTDPFELAVTPRNFEEHLEVLRNRARPISLERLAGELRSGRISAGGVVVTFDDGYADNLHAGRLLERFEVPATVFISAGFIGGGREFWWDELEALVMHPTTLPERLPPALRTGFGTGEWGGPLDYGEADWIRHVRWRYEDDEIPSPRHHLFRQLYPYLRRRSVADRDEVLRELRLWAGLDPLNRLDYRTLTEEELTELAKNPLIEIGGHTQNHPWLPALPAQEQYDEIRAAKSWLEDRLGRSISGFSYPYGAYDQVTSSAAREAGFTNAVTCEAVAVSRRCDLMELPRFCPGNWDGDEFARRLRAWLRS
jgi:peptidoglycan/xylan/chitin deacetylase (PgdA/CDA1 family)